MHNESVFNDDSDDNNVFHFICITSIQLYGEKCTIDIHSIVRDFENYRVNNKSEIGKYTDLQVVRFAFLASESTTQLLKY